MKQVLSFSLLLIFLSGCIDYHEKMKLNNDGSGEITFAVGISESLFNMSGEGGELKDFQESKIKKNFESKPGIKLISSRTYSEDGNKWIEIHLSFKSLDALNEVSKDSSQQGMLGQCSLSEDSKGNMVFTKTLAGKDNQAEKDSSSNPASKGMMEMMFGKYKWTYELAVPGRIVSTNADQENIDNSKNTVKWSLSMASLSQPKILTVTFEKAGVSNLTLVILAIIGVIVLSLVCFYRIKNKKSETLQ